MISFLQAAFSMLAVVLLAAGILILAQKAAK